MRGQSSPVYMLGPNMTLLAINQAIYFGSAEGARAELKAVGLLFELGNTVQLIEQGSFDSYYDWYLNTVSCVLGADNGTA